MLLLPKAANHCRLKYKSSQNNLDSKHELGEVKKHINSNLTDVIIKYADQGWRRCQGWQEEMSFRNLVVQPNADIVLMQWVLLFILLYIKFSGDEIVKRLACLNLCASCF